jgi:hypothetical protein
MRNNTKKQEKIFLLSLVALIVFGTLFSINTWTTSLKTTDEEAKYIATIGEIFLNGEAFKKLTGTEEDLGTVSYESMKLRMLNFIGIQKGIRFAYIYTLRDDKVYFMVDSEPVLTK